MKIKKTFWTACDIWMRIKAPANIAILPWSRASISSSYDSLAAWILLATYISINSARFSAHFFDYWNRVVERELSSFSFDLESMRYSFSGFAHAKRVSQILRLSSHRTLLVRISTRGHAQASSICIHNLFFMLAMRLFMYPFDPAIACSELKTAYSNGSLSLDFNAGLAVAFNFCTVVQLRYFVYFMAIIAQLDIFPHFPPHTPTTTTTSSSWMRLIVCVTAIQCLRDCRRLLLDVFVVKSSAMLNIAGKCRRVGEVQKPQQQQQKLRWGREFQ